MTAPAGARRTLPTGVPYRAPAIVQGLADERRGGPLVLTGSQHFLLLEKISQSLAGRAAGVEALPEAVARRWAFPSSFR